LQAFLPASDLSMLRCHNPNSTLFLNQYWNPAKKLSFGSVIRMNRYTTFKKFMIVDSWWKC
jgi:hypothetical protein